MTDLRTACTHLTWVASSGALTLQTAILLHRWLPAASLPSFGAEGLATPTAADTRRFYNSPDVAIFSDARQNRRFISVSIGSGYRAHPLDLSATDRFYSLRDPNVFNSLTQAEYDAFVPFTETDLVDVTGQVDVTVTASDAGWMLTLPSNQMVLADSVTFNDEVFFVSFSPDSDRRSRL